FILSPNVHHPNLHSFPTRRSSDLTHPEDRELHPCRVAAATSGRAACAQPVHGPGRLLRIQWRVAGGCRELQGHGSKEASDKEKHQCQAMRAESWTLYASAMARSRVAKNRVADVPLQLKSPKPSAILRKNWPSPSKPTWGWD